MQVRVDPRSVTTPEALQTRFKASQSVAELQRAFIESAAVVATLAKELEAANAAIKERREGQDRGGGAVPDAVTSAVKDFTKKVDDLKEKFKAGWGGPKFLIFDLSGQLQASTSMPTEAQLRVIDQMNTRLTTDIATLNTVASKDLPALQAALRARASRRRDEGGGAAEDAVGAAHSPAPLPRERGLSRRGPPSPTLNSG